MEKEREEVGQCTKPHLKRESLPNERQGVTWKVKIGDLNGVQLGETSMPAEGVYIKAYIRTGEYQDGELGEVFISPDKEGSFIQGVLDGFALLLSIALQYGVPLEKIIEKFMNIRFEPSGMTSDRAVPMATSFFDLMFKKLALRYLDSKTCGELGIADRSKPEEGEGNAEEEWQSSAGRVTTGLSGSPFHDPKVKQPPVSEDVEGGADEEALTGA
jgi:ribonucleoside-diphosphate reductase alpha chain